MQRRSIVKRLLIALMAGLVLALPLAGTAGPDETQKLMIQRAQEAKKKLAAAQAATGAERQKMMQEHMKLMQEMMTQMRAAKPRDGMTPQQMREWIDEHLKLMDQMMSQMMDEHHMMMQGSMMQGSMMKGASK
jgi:ABC-type transporter MlaC component